MTLEEKALLVTHLSGFTGRQKKRDQRREFSRKYDKLLLALKEGRCGNLHDAMQVLADIGIDYVVDRKPPMGVMTIDPTGCPVMVFSRISGEFLGKDYHRPHEPTLDDAPLFNVDLSDLPEMDDPDTPEWLLETEVAV
jgi:hypothetical protein